MELDIYSLSDPGRVRELNEDAVLHDLISGIAVLADGMGGYNAGEVASSMACTTIGEELPKRLRWKANHDSIELHQLLQESVQAANLDIYRAANENEQYSGMGTTLVMALFRGSQVYIGHVGDSRAYRFRAGELQQLTRDHSLLQEQLDLGLITPEEAQYSLNKNLVTRALGVEPQVILEINEHRVEAQDIYMLCSDGLTDMLSDNEIERTITETGFDLDATAQRLVFKANEAGGRDNISVIFLKVKAFEAVAGTLLNRLSGWFKT
jgi:PPM family protein phosphatase